MLAADITRGSAAFCPISAGVGQSRGSYAFIYHLRKNFPPFVHSARLGLAARQFLRKK
jgi:hypothetical protein